MSVVVNTTTPPQSNVVTSQVTAGNETTEYAYASPLPLRIKDWDFETLSEANMCQLVHSPIADERRLDVLAKRYDVPIIGITGTLYQEIKHIINKNPSSECAMFLLMKKMDPNKPHWLAFDLYMPKQSATGAAVDLDGEDCEAFYKDMLSVPYYKDNGMHRFVCHLHSHAGMGAFWSATDNNQQLSRDDMGFKDEYRLYIVMNVKEEIKASFVSYKPVLQRVDAAVAVVFSQDEYIAPLTRARKAELDSMVDERLELPKAVTTLAYQNYQQGAWAEFNMLDYGGGVVTHPDKKAYSPLGHKDGKVCGTPGTSKYWNTESGRYTGTKDNTFKSVPVKVTPQVKYTNTATANTSLQETQQTINYTKLEDAALYLQDLVTVLSETSLGPNYLAAFISGMPLKINDVIKTDLYNFAAVVIEAIQDETMAVQENDLHGLFRAAGIYMTAIISELAGAAYSTQMAPDDDLLAILTTDYERSWLHHDMQVDMVDDLSTDVLDMLYDDISAMLLRVRGTHQR